MATAASVLFAVVSFAVSVSSAFWKFNQTDVDQQNETYARRNNDKKLQDQINVLTSQQYDATIRFYEFQIEQLKSKK